MIYKTKTRKKEMNSRDFVHLWAKYYREATGHKYFINYVKECAAMKRLMSDFTDKELSSLINLAFQDTNLKRHGFPIALLPYSINKLMPKVDNPGSEIPDWELELDIPISDDERTAWLWKRIRAGNLNQIIHIVKSKTPWLVLMGKLQHSRGFIPELVTIYYDRWRMKERIMRRAVR